jgi:hypothetical protein
MNATSATATSEHEGIGMRLRLCNVAIGALFAVVLRTNKLCQIRKSPSVRLAFRIFLGVAGAALVIFPLGSWNSWLVAIAGLGIFLAAILLPPVPSPTVSEEKALELGALSVVNGGQYQRGNGVPAAVQLYVGVEKIWALDSHLQPLLLIPATEINSVNTNPEKDRWILYVRWPGMSAEFSYQGIFAEPRARVAKGILSSVMHSPIPVLPRSRAASA